jgi:hypothetical protein
MGVVNDKQQFIAEKLLETTALQLATASKFFAQEGQKTTLCISLAMVPVTNLCAGFTHRGREEGKDFRPTPDDLLFSCLVISNSCWFSTEGAMAAEFSYEHLIQSLDQFREMTRRSYEPELDYNLLQNINKVREEASSVPPSISKFMPN